jgi:serine/threonine protein kinase
MALVGTFVDKLLLVKEIGQGAFATVYLAYSKISKKQFAIKCLDKRNQSSKNNLLRQEAKILAKIQHDNIVRFVKTIETKDFIYIIQEYCNMDLYSYLRQSKKFDTQSLKLKFTDLCSAVSYLHSINIFHRDLKPENILLDYKGKVKICDFGLASETRNSFEFGCGSVHTMAPECLIENYTKGSFTKSYNCPATDVWSLGIILINMLQINPWHSATQFNIDFRRHFNLDQTNFTNTDTDTFQSEFGFSTQICKILRLCFKLNPLERPSPTTLANMVADVHLFYNNDLIKLKKKRHLNSFWLMLEIDRYDLSTWKIIMFHQLRNFLRLLLYFSIVLCHYK